MLQYYQGVMSGEEDVSVEKNFFSLDAITTNFRLALDILASHQRIY
jgi:hypothetical protein